MLSVLVRSSEIVDCFWFCIKYNKEFYFSNAKIANLLGMETNEFEQYFLNNFSSCEHYKISGLLFRNKKDCEEAAQWIYDNFDNLILMKKLTSN